MKNTKIQSGWFIAAIFAVLVATAGYGSAWMGDYRHQERGFNQYPMGTNYAPGDVWTNWREFPEPYRDQAKELQQQLQTKYSELAEARATGSTTLAQLDAIKKDLHELRLQYRSLLAKADMPVAGRTGYSQSRGHQANCGCTHCRNRSYSHSSERGYHRNCCW